MERILNFVLDHIFLFQIVAHWIDRYDWRQEEAKINQHPHYRTNIEGLDIHFVRIKPTSVDRNTDVYPIVMFHGWPGSFFEMWYMLPHLLQPKKLPNGRNVALEIILPSLPGFGFSDKPETPGKIDDYTKYASVVLPSTASLLFSVNSLGEYLVRKCP